MPQVRDVDDPSRVVNFENDPVVPDSEPPKIATAPQLADAARTRIGGELLERVDKALLYARRKASKISFGGLCEDDPIFRHAACRGASTGA